MESPVVTKDALCFACGYSLSGLGAEGKCPECGIDIQRSLHGDRLAFADPSWLRRITRGQAILSYGMLVSNVALILLIVVPLLLAVLGQVGGSGWFVAMSIIVLGFLIAAFLGLFAAAVGLFLVTALDPRASITEEPVSPRHLARWGIVACLSLGIASRSVGFLFPFSQRPGVRMIVALLVACGLAVTIRAALRYLAMLAARVPDKGLQQRCTDVARRLIWEIPLAVALIVMSKIWALPGTGAGSLWTAVPQTLMACAGPVSMLYLLVVLGRIASVMTQLRKAFQNCARESASVFGKGPPNQGNT